MKKAVVTGAAGFVGMNVTEALQKAGYFVYAVVRPGSEHNERIQEAENIRKVELDAHELERLPMYIAEPCDVFFNLVVRGQYDAFDVQRENIDFAIAAVRAAHALGCTRFVMTGSQAEYGCVHHEITEEQLPDPVTSYGAAKLAACYLTRNLAAQLGIEWVWGRIFSTFGKYELPTTMIGYLIRTLAKGESPVLTDATQHWSYTYSTDVAEAIVALAERGRSGEIYNISTAEHHPLKYYTERIRSFMGADVPAIRYGKKAWNGVELMPVVEKIRRDTGWQAKVSFDEGLTRAYADYAAK